MEGEWRLLIVLRRDEDDTPERPSLGCACVPSDVEVCTETEVTTCLAEPLSSFPFALSGARDAEVESSSGESDEGRPLLSRGRPSESKVRNRKTRLPA